jgi:hypothetical protein
MRKNVQYMRGREELTYVCFPYKEVVGGALLFLKIM